MLNTKDAIQLYKYLEKFTPDYREYDDSLEFAGKIIQDIGKSDNPEAFGESILLMYPDMSLDRLAEMSGQNVLKLFLDGMAENKFLLLVEFCRALGYG